MTGKIQNILFDMGGVLLRFEPAAFVKRLGLGEEDSLQLLREVFRAPEWVMMDRGTLDEPEALAAMCARLPETLHAAARELVYHWDEPRTPMPGMPELAAELAGRGYGLYLLSNASRRHHSYWPKLPVAECFGDRLFISADYGLLKPDTAFYEKALDTFRLDRSACVFIDDFPSNVEAAIHVGIAGLVFHGDAALLRRRLRELGVEVDP